MQAWLGNSEHRVTLGGMVPLCCEHPARAVQPGVWRSCIPGMVGYFGFALREIRKSCFEILSLLLFFCHSIWFDFMMPTSQPLSASMCLKLWDGTCL